MRPEGMGPVQRENALGWLVIGLRSCWGLGCALCECVCVSVCVRVCTCVSLRGCVDSRAPWRPRDQDGTGPLKRKAVLGGPGGDKALGVRAVCFTRQAVP